MSSPIIKSALIERADIEDAVLMPGEQADESVPTAKAWAAARRASWWSHLMRRKREPRIIVVNIPGSTDKAVFLDLNGTPFFLPKQPFANTGRSRVYKARDEQGYNLVVKQEFLGYEPTIPDVAINKLFSVHQNVFTAPLFSHPDFNWDRAIDSDLMAQYTIMDYKGPQDFEKYTNSCDDSGGLSLLNASLASLEALLSLEIMHKVGVGHFDIKPSNFIPQLNAKGHISAMLPIDFDTAHIFTENEATLRLSGDLRGTPPFIPPETLLSLDPNENEKGAVYSRAGDLFSLGVMMVFFTPLLGINKSNDAYKEIVKHSNQRSGFRHLRENPNEKKDYFLEIFKKHGPSDKLNLGAELVLQLLCGDKDERVKYSAEEGSIYHKIRRAIGAIAKAKLAQEELSQEDYHIIESRLADHEKLLKFIEDHKAEVKKTFLGRTHLNICTVDSSKEKFLKIQKHIKRRTLLGQRTRTYHLLHKHGWLSRGKVDEKQSPQEFRELSKNTH